MEIVQDVIFRDEMVILDGKHFIDCTIESCTLEYSGGTVILERTHFSSCQYFFFDHGQKTINFLQVFGLVTRNWHVCEEISEVVH